MKENVRHGTWFTRQLIRLFTVILAVLFFWLLGFVVEDIEAIPGPTFAEIEHKYVDAKLVEQNDRLQKQIGELEQRIAGQAGQQQIVRDSSENLQRTIQQLLQLKKSSVEKSVSFSDSDAKLLTASLNEFFDSQKTYQKINQTISDLTSQKGRLGSEKSRVEEEIAKQREPAKREYDRLTETHRLRLAFYQLLILVPLLLATAYPLVKRRGGLYYPLFLAVGGATLLKVTLVVHEYFPSRYFKYISDSRTAAGRGSAVGLPDSHGGVSESGVDEAAVSRGVRAVSLPGVRISDSHRSAQIPLLDATHGPQGFAARRLLGRRRSLHLSRLRHGGVRGLRFVQERCGTRCSTIASTAEQPRKGQAASRRPLSLWERVRVRAYGANRMWFCSVHQALTPGPSPKGRGEMLPLVDSRMLSVAVLPVAPAATVSSVISLGQAASRMGRKLFAGRRSSSILKPSSRIMLENRSLKRDLLALALLAAVIFLAAALFSYDPADPPTKLVFPPHSQPANACGYWGAVVSRLLFEAVGIGAYYVLVSLAAFDAVLLLRRDTNHLWLRTIGWLLSLAGFTTLAALAVPWLSPGPVIGAGGYLGVTGRALLQTHFASVGSYILSISLLLGGLLLSTDYALVRLFVWIVAKLTSKTGPRRGSSQHCLCSEAQPTSLRSRRL